jgi:hypothetical protein
VEFKMLSFFLLKLEYFLMTKMQINNIFVLFCREEDERQQRVSTGEDMCMLPGKTSTFRDSAHKGLQFLQQAKYFYSVTISTSFPLFAIQLHICGRMQ